MKSYEGTQQNLIYIKQELLQGIKNPPESEFRLHIQYIVEKVMIHEFYPSLTSDLQPTKSNPLILLVQPWLLASILL